MYRHTGPLYKYQREVGPQCTDTENLYLKFRGEVAI